MHRHSRGEIEAVESKTEIANKGVGPQRVALIQN
jgi:hypothetical protein